MLDIFVSALALSTHTLPSISNAPSIKNGIVSPSAYSTYAASSSAIGHFATLSRRSRGSELSKFSWHPMDRKVNSCSKYNYVLKKLFC
jgi:hypothetical protein